ncbi:hypothetical protein EBT25_01120 [bacterium]|nr:hypothetical protein [bacterium]
MQVHSTKYALARQAAQWGADQELEACCEWLQDPDLNVDTYKLRAARRPKPPSLKELNLKHLEVMERDGHYLPEIIADLRRAIESLPS